MELKISPGNRKLGEIPNISLSPIKSCPDLPCKEHCYAVKAAERWKVARNAWETNWQLYRQAPVQFFRELCAWLLVHSPKKFRWHVAGDIPVHYYFQMMKEIARSYKKTKFLVFTKRYYLFANIGDLPPQNLSVILSVWPGVPFLNPNGFPMAFIEGDKRAKNYIKCKSNCDSCNACFDLAKKKKNVLLKPLSFYTP